MWHDFYSFMRNESIKAVQWAKCGESILSTVPTVLWAMGTAALAQRLVTALFRRFLFRRVPLWELVLQNLLFIWMVIYSLHFWVVLVKLVKVLVNYCYNEDIQTEEDIESKRLMQQWLVWMCSAAPLVVYIGTQPRPETPTLMIWLTNSPWQRREMGPYGYYLQRPLTSLQPNVEPAPRQAALRKAVSDSRVIIKEPPKKRRYSKSV